MAQKSMGLLRAGRVYTAYDICGHVAKQVLEEPKRLDMSWWVPLFKGERTKGVFRSFISIYAHNTGDGPACGTAACLAGWMGLNMRLDPEHVNGTTVLSALGADLDFGGFTKPGTVWGALDDLFGDTHSRHAYGTKAYASEYACKLRALMKTYRNELQAQRIKITTAGPVPVA